LTRERNTCWSLLAAVALGVLPATLRAQTGVSDDRVSLPDGPGSLGGVGENASIDQNMGLMSSSVPIDLPHGFPNMTPQLQLSYSSGGGMSVVGMGWSLGTPAIERMTARGLPKYATEDEFSGDTGELVRVVNADPAVYRARFEGGFVRYTWRDRGTGAGGYWTAEYPDGRVGYFGADSSGTVVPSARVTTPSGGVFKYHLVEMVDVDDHEIRYAYTKTAAGFVLPQSIGWVHNPDGTPHHDVTFTYENRDDLLSDCKPGFNMVLDKRLKSLTVRVGGQVLHRYDLGFEDYDESGGFTRLMDVRKYAWDGSMHPVHLQFTYSRALGGVCHDALCGQPFLVSMGSLGVSMQSGTATLIDINGDGLPDVVNTPHSGNHQFFLSNLQANGTHTYDAPTQSAVGNSSTRLGPASVQVFDVNGDGFSDLINTKTGVVLYNRGTGDWSTESSVVTNALPDFDADASDGTISIKFLDYDNDKKIDVIRSTNVDTQIFRNTGDDFVEDVTTTPVGAGFAEDGLQMNDMNGDGLLDAVVVAVGMLKYRLNLGYGQWGPWVEILNMPISNDNEKGLSEVEDINGDGLADLVVVSGTTVKYSINRNGASFLPAETISSAQGGSIPERLSTTSVLYADMNGNGSADVVWIDQNGGVTYLELFPIRPNLISKIENGLGSMTLVTYASGVQMMAKDGGSQAWVHRIPHSTLVVDKIVVTDLLNNLEEDTSFRYHDAYYDGTDKAFRGFSRTESFSDEDTWQESSRTQTIFDLGVTDRYRAGLHLSTDAESGGRAIKSVTNTYEDCPVAEVPASGLRFPVRWICQTKITTVTKEGRPEAEWVTTEERTSFDGYGNVVKSEKLGVTQIGAGACPACDRDPSVFGAPCGNQCLGDEQYTETEYVLPPDQSHTGGKWILRAHKRVSSYGRPGGIASEALTYYDGDPFVGLPHGTLTKGRATRETARVSSTGPDVVNVSRNRYDADGNPVETLDANAELSSLDNRRTWAYDSRGLVVTRTEQFLLDESNQPYILRRDYAYDPLHNLPSEATSWMVVVGGVVQSPRNSSFFSYDQFGRVTSIVSPGGDTLQSPTQVFTYDMGSPVSKVTVRKRSRVGQPLDHEEIRCFDGQGRDYQDRTRIASNRWLVNGFVIHNRQGEEVEHYQAYESDSPECDLLPPEGVLSEKSAYDAMGRTLRTVLPDGSLYGTPSETRTEHLPLAEVNWDEEDADPSSPHSGTPTTIRSDGLGRPVAVERRLTSGGPATVHKITYDELGHVRGYVGPRGVEKVQEYNLLGRMVRVTDPDRGVFTYQYDPHGKVTHEVDARGKVTRTSYDGTNRVRATWEEGAEEATRLSYTYDRLTPGQCPVDKCTNLAGQVARIVYPVGGEVGEDRFGYNGRGNGLYSSRRIGAKLFEFSQTLNNLDLVVATAYPMGRSVSYQYDDAGRLAAVPGYVTSVSYAPRGTISGVTLANGVVTTQAHDARMRLTSIVTGPASGDPLVALGYTRNRLGHVTAIRDNRPDDGGPSAKMDLTYDGLNRLVRAEMDNGRAAHQETQSLTYDDLDRIVTNESSRAGSRAHVGTYTYDQTRVNNLTRAGSLVMQYDAAGNITHRGEDAYQWDYQNRLSAVVRAGETISSFAYGPGYQRVVRKEGGKTTYYLSPDYDIRDGVATLYVRMGDLKLVKLESTEMGPEVLSDLAPVELSGTSGLPDPDDTITAADAWIAEAVRQSIFTLSDGSTPSDTRALLAASARRLLVGNADLVTYLHFDHLGTTVATSDATGQRVQHLTYYPFGLARSSTGGAVDDALYTGKELDESSGLLFFGARYADPWTCRWTSPDPAFAVFDEKAIKNLDEAVNPYVFAGNNPVSGKDEEGKFFTFGPIGAVIGAVVGAVGEILAQKNRGEKISWGSVAMAAGIGALAGGFGGELGIAAMVAGYAAEIISYRVADNHYQKKVASGEMSPEKAHSKATFASKVVGGVVGAVVNLGGAIATAVKEVGKGLLKVGMAVGGALAKVAWAKYGTKIKTALKSAAVSVGKAAWKFMKAVGRGIGKLAAKVGNALANAGAKVAHAVGNAVKTAVVATARATMQGISSGAGLVAKGAMALAQAATKLEKATAPSK
jgi:RHS repeat-associated protein